ncbi:MAG: glucose 1-dehydrogenase [Bacteroidetes bacterium]|jgi:NAD(P)-dependent dehydrogenase (short-subunit alcohol dehydrogenase family)|nr:glucose 1-dehydrogenase [Bacteroidota bacterium]
MYSLDGQTAIITGSGSGIGAAIADLFAEQGADVAVLDVDTTAGAETVERITAAGGSAAFFECDVSDQSAVQATFDAIAQTFGGVDVLINNAGVAHIGDVESTTEEDFDRIYRVNVKGVYNGLHASIPLMKDDGGGSIVNIASVVSTVGIPDRFAYSMSKGAVLTMTYSVACDYLDDNIRCNSIAPARVHTPFVDGFLAENYPDRQDEMFEQLSQTQPIGRMGTPEEIAHLALYLSSDAAGFITGSNFPIDGGFTTLKP